METSVNERLSAVLEEISEFSEPESSISLPKPNIIGDVTSSK